MATAHPVTGTDQATAERIRETAAAQYDQIRSNGNLSQTAIRTGIAEVYVKAKTDIEKLATNSAAAIETNTRKLNTAAFGIDDIAGTNPVDRAAASVSYRDAQDRVATLESQFIALELLARAESTGDELLARAIAHRGYDLGWEDILDTYAATRPRAGQAIADLAGTRTRTFVGDIFAFVIVPPSELVGLRDYEIAALANPTTSA